MIARGGTFLVICMVLTTIIIIMSFAILHNITAETDVSTGNQRYLLAQQAAETGLDHAVEEILADYGQTTLTLPAVGGATVTVPAIQHLDGQWRAPFTAIHYPNYCGWSSETNLLSCDDDVRVEDYVCRPWAWWWFDVNGNWNAGYSEYDGKGRYYEPGYYNITPTAPGSAAPVVAVPFTNASVALPERSQGMFYDEQFRRVTPSGNPVVDRQNARYRLRYTVGVEDLQGHFLVNPMPDMQMLATPGQNVDYRTPAANYPFMTGSTYVLMDLVGTTGGSTFGAQLAHVFEGRGYHTNIDFDHGATGLVGWPETFPLMYRGHPQLEYGNTGQGGWESCIDGVNNTVTTPPLPTPAPPSLTDQLYYDQVTNGKVKGLATGGEVIPTSCGDDGANFWPYSNSTIFHCLMGPMLSPQEVIYAAHGETAYLGPEGQGGSGQPRPYDCFMLTPFGRGQIAASYTPPQSKWYQGHVSTPFHINVMTAPPQVIYDMILGYIPPQNKTIQFASINWNHYIGVVDGEGAYESYSQPINPGAAGNAGSLYGIDLLCSTTCPPALAQWPPPTRVDPPSPTPTVGIPDDYNPPNARGIGQVISPDYYCHDLRLKQTPIVWPYPGAFMEGTSGVTGQGSDNLGTLMDETSLSNPYDFYTQQPFVYLPGGSPYQYYQEPGGRTDYPDPVEIANITGWASVAPPVANMVSPGCAGPCPFTWGTLGPDGAEHDEVQKETSGIAESARQSYFLDLVVGLGTAIGVLRAEYVHYALPGWTSSNNWWGRGTAHALADPNPAHFITLHDLDRVFLAEMGESLSAPGTGSPSTLAAAGTLVAYRFHPRGIYPAITPDYIPANNILSLVTNNLIPNDDNSVSSRQRGHVMSLMLNDMRMSFLGSSPAYSDGIDPTTGQPNPALAFQPLDFMGDGKAYCSCYTTTDSDGLPYAADGTPPVNYFTITGNLFMGKSHYFRIFSRGEIWDNLLQSKMNAATLDAAIAVDPEGTNPLDTQMLYQRWIYDRYYGNISHVQR